MYLSKYLYFTDDQYGEKCRHLYRMEKIKVNVVNISIDVKVIYVCAIIK